MRIFAALSLPDKALEALEPYFEFLKSNYRGLKPVQPKGLHITLHFFGELNPGQVQDLITLMNTSSALKRPPIDTVLLGLEQFPPKGQPRVIYTPLGQGSSDIINFQKTYLKEISGLGYRPEQKRDSKVHITLARNKFARVPAGSLDKFIYEPFEFSLDKFVLFESRLTPRGAHYTALEEVELTRYY
ncbi:MAG: RNA 2',3'-cyclic phosphodiesterase [Spirochaetales bacterium]|nr:RNA 2',3'-cyclic phosphodiesterase [Spirochaetales bacterium]